MFPTYIVAIKGFFIVDAGGKAKPYKHLCVLYLLWLCSSFNYHTQSHNFQTIKIKFIFELVKATLILTLMFIAHICTQP